MSELYKAGSFDSLSVLFELEGDSTKINFKYTPTPRIREIEIYSDGTIDSSSAQFLIRSLKDKPFNGRLIFDVIRKFILDYKRRGFVLFNLEDHSFNVDNGKPVQNIDEGDPGSVTYSAGTNYTGRSHTGTRAGKMETRQVSSTGTYGAVFTGNANSRSIIHGVALKDAGGAGAASFVFLPRHPMAHLLTR